ncbi:MAG: hypothetical protein ACE5FN_09415 [Leptospirillia bacterium]
MNRIHYTLLAVFMVLVLAPVPQAPACGPEENMTHFGVIASLDRQMGIVTLVDAQTGAYLEFSATAEQMMGLNPHARVAIKYLKQDGKLVAEEIQHS